MSGRSSKTVVVLAGLLTICSVAAQQRWYYTGKFQNEDIIDPIFDGSQFVESDLHSPDLVALLYYGGLITNSTNISPDDYAKMAEFIQFDLLGFGGGTATRIDYAAALPMVLSRNYGAYENFPMNSSVEDYLLLHHRAEVGLYDHQQRVFLEKYWRDLGVGELVTVKLSLKHNHAPATHAVETAAVMQALEEAATFEIDVSTTGEASVVDTSNGTAGIDPAIVEVSSADALLAHNSTHHHSSTSASVVFDEEHRIVYTTDLMGRSSVYSHTWGVPHVVEAPEECELADTQAAKKDVRVMSFNLWHNNPPSWVYHNHKDRWDRYTRRMKHFADVIVAEDPDVIALQEVRVDSAFVSPITGHTIAHWHNLTHSKEDGGNQVEHVLSHLAQARLRAAAALSAHNGVAEGDGEGGDEDEGAQAQVELNGNPYYQFVYQPAMSMVDTQRLAFRHEEGVMVLSKFPIVDYQVVLLPRHMDDKSDDHQRVILNVKVAVPEAHVRTQSSACSSPDAVEPVTLDIMTSHFSLNERARNQGVRTLVQEITRSDNDKYSPSPIQILMGDFNAEPEEVAIKYLLDEANFNADKCARVENSVDGSTEPCDRDSLGARRAPFVDAWQHFQTARRVSIEEDPGLTFPACNPVKRIDFIMVRNASAVDAQVAHMDEPRVHATVQDFRIEGIRPTADTEHLVNSREGLGMNDKDSPIWASDHFAVVTDLRIVRR